jgi:hypothetical protein
VNLALSWQSERRFKSEVGDILCAREAVKGEEASPAIATAGVTGRAGADARG